MKNDRAFPHPAGRHDGDGSQPGHDSHDSHDRHESSATSVLHEITPGVRQEMDRIRSRPVTAAILAAVTLGALGVLWAGLHVRGRVELYRPAGVHALRGDAVIAPTTIGGIYQTLIGSDSTLLHMHRQQRLRLQSFEWIDESRGIARIPIDQAMDAIIARSRQ